MVALRTFFCATLAVIAVSTVGMRATNVREEETIAAQDASATYVRVCVNHRGVPDRRACHHTSRQDPQRTTLALR